MLNDKKKLETYFINEIKRVSDIEIKQIEEEIFSIQTKSIQSFEAQTQREAKQASQQGLKELQNEYAIRLSKVYEDSNHKLMKKRRELADKVFKEAIQKINEFTLTMEYTDYLCKKIQELSKCIDDCIVLYVAQKDEKILPVLCEAYGSNCQGEVDATIKVGGFRVLCESKGIVMDETFDSSIDEQKSWFYTNSGLFIK